MEVIIDLRYRKLRRMIQFELESKDLKMKYYFRKKDMIYTAVECTKTNETFAVLFKIIKEEKKQAVISEIIGDELIFKYNPPEELMNLLNPKNKEDNFKCKSIYLYEEKLKNEEIQKVKDKITKNIVDIIKNKKVLIFNSKEEAIKIGLIDNIFKKYNIDFFKDFYEYIKENNYLDKTAYKYVEHKYENKFKRITRHFIILDFDEVLNREELRKFLNLYNIMEKESLIKFCNEYKGEN